MRFLVVTASLIAVLGIGSATVLNRSGRQLLNDATWKVESESPDHITYVRKPVVETRSLQEGQVPKNNVDCNQTTTTATPPTSRRRSGSYKNRLEVRSGLERTGGSSSRRKGSSGQESSTYATTTGSNNFDGYDGDELWKVGHRTDDHITYVRRGSSGSSSVSSGQGQGQGQGQPGELRRLGTGRDSVLARVVVPGKDDELTEEGIIEGATHQSSRGRHTGYPTNELVHPYVKKTIKANNSSSLRRKSLKSGGRRDRNNQARSSSAAALSHPPNVDLSGDDQSPKVGENVNGWVVISKSKDHISWERAGASPSTQTNVASFAVSNLRARNTQNENRLKSLKSANIKPNSNAGDNKRGRKLIPSAEGELIEGFPRVFNTYSRAFYVNERNIDNVGTIRTSLSDSSNWRVGDELAGWKVISKDHRGIVWQRIQTQSQNASSVSNNNGNNVGIVDEEDLLESLNKQGGDEASSSESDSSSESESNEGEKVYHGPPGTWYLAKETKNSITWQRDDLPADIVFEMDAYPRVGDMQSGWKVTSKSRDHISWVRANNDGSEVESKEETP